MRRPKNRNFFMMDPPCPNIRVRAIIASAEGFCASKRGDILHFFVSYACMSKCFCLLFDQIFCNPPKVGVVMTDNLSYNKENSYITFVIFGEQKISARSRIDGGGGGELFGVPKRAFRQYFRMIKLHIHRRGISRMHHYKITEVTRYGKSEEDSRRSAERGIPLLGGCVCGRMCLDVCHGRERPRLHGGSALPPMTGQRGRMER